MVKHHYIYAFANVCNHQFFIFKHFIHGFLFPLPRKWFQCPLLITILDIHFFKIILTICFFDLFFLYLLMINMFLILFRNNVHAMTFSFVPPRWCFILAIPPQQVCKQYLHYTKNLFSMISCNIYSFLLLCLTHCLYQQS